MAEAKANDQAKGQATIEPGEFETLLEGVSTQV